MTEEFESELIRAMANPQLVSQGGDEFKEFLRKEKVNAVINNRLAMLGAAYNNPRVMNVIDITGVFKDCERQFMKNGGVARVQALQAVSNRWAGQQTTPPTIIEKITGKK